MTAPNTDFDAPVPSDELRVHGPIFVMVLPELKVSPRFLEDTTLTMSAAAAPSVASSVKM